MESFPAFFPLAGRRVVIVGSGEHAQGKARLFEGSPAQVEHIDDGRPGGRMRETTPWRMFSPCSGRGGGPRPRYGFH